MKKIVVMSLFMVSTMILVGCSSDDDETALENHNAKTTAGNFAPASNISDSNESKTEPNTQDTKIMSKPETDEIAARHESVKTKDDGTQYLSIVEETDDYIINVEIPSSNSSQVKDSIDKALENIEKRFKRAVVEDQDTPSELEVSFEKTVLNDELVIYNQRAESKNTNADRTYLHTFIEHEDELLTFSDIFDDSEEARELYKYHVLERLNQEDIDHINTQAVKRAIVDSDSALEKVYPSEDGLVFQFNTMEIGGAEAGTPEVVVPFENISQLMTEKCDELIGEMAEDWTLKDAYAGSQSPSKYDKFYQIREDIDTDKQLVALTFDDGPVSGTTEMILDTLAEHDVKATFFVLGSMVAEYPELAQRIVDEGHEIANHSYTHPELTKLNEASLQSEIGRTQQAIQEHTGTWALTFRPPYGDTNQYVRDTVGLTEVLWNIDTLDWQTRNTNLIYNSVMTNVGDGSVVLMHDIVDATPQAVVNLMDNLDKNQFEFVTVSELYEYREDVYSFTQSNY